MNLSFDLYCRTYLLLTRKEQTGKAKKFQTLLLCILKSVTSPLMVNICGCKGELYCLYKNLIFMSTVIISLLIKMTLLESRACDIINIESTPSEFKIRSCNLGGDTE